MQTKLPKLSVVIVVPTALQSEPPVGVCHSELNERVASDDGVNPDPVTVYDAPIGPWVGLTVMVGVMAGINPEELGAAGEGVTDGEETMTAVGPLRETV